MPLLPKTNAKLSYKESYKAKSMLLCKQEFANYFQIFEYVQSFDKRFTCLHNTTGKKESCRQAIL